MGVSEDRPGAWIVAAGRFQSTDGALGQVTDGRMLELAFVAAVPGNLHGLPAGVPATRSSGRTKIVRHPSAPAGTGRAGASSTQLVGRRRRLWLRRMNCSQRPRHETCSGRAAEVAGRRAMCGGDARSPCSSNLQGNPSCGSTGPNTVQAQPAAGATRSCSPAGQVRPAAPGFRAVVGLPRPSSHPRHRALGDRHPADGRGPGSPSKRTNEHGRPSRGSCPPGGSRRSKGVERHLSRGPTSRRSRRRTSPTSSWPAQVAPPTSSALFVRPQAAAGRRRACGAAPCARRTGSEARIVRQGRGRSRPYENLDEIIAAADGRDDRPRRTNGVTAGLARGCR